jgi:putative transposase
LTARRINAIRNTPGVQLWQRNYYEHVIRTEIELEHIREYIRANPINWTPDNQRRW